MYLLLFFIIFCSCSNKHNDIIVVINTYKPDFPFACNIVFDGEIYHIEHLRKYRRKKLIEFQGCAAERLYTYNFEKIGNDYLKEDLEVKTLRL